MDRRLFLRLAGITGGLSLMGRAQGASLDSVHFADELLVLDTRLRLRGTGVYYYKIFFKVAAAGLYLDQIARPQDVLADVAKRLEMQYFWSVKAADLIAGSDALLNRNLSVQTRSRVSPQIEQMFKLYKNVSAGDRSVLMYLPGSGTSLWLNGQRLGTVPGFEFAAAFFSIWFGDQPLDSGLKRNLLGRP
jgi:hypothetical protein